MSPAQWSAARCTWSRDLLAWHQLFYVANVLDRGATAVRGTRAFGPLEGMLRVAAG